MIISDQNMTIMNGDEYVKKVIYIGQVRQIEREEEHQKTFIIGHSSDDNQGTIDRFINAGADEFEQKPVNVENLLAIIKKQILAQIYNEHS